MHATWCVTLLPPGTIATGPDCSHLACGSVHGGQSLGLYLSAAHGRAPSAACTCAESASAGSGTISGSASPALLPAPPALCGGFKGGAPSADAA